MKALLRWPLTWHLQWQVLLCMLVGASNVLAFAPFGFWPIQLLTLALLFHLTLSDSDAPIKHHAWRGWGFGLGWTGCGMYWLYITMYHYAQLPLLVAATAVLLLAMFYLGPFSALAVAGSAWLRRRWGLSANLSAVLLLPAAWAVTEWMRGWLLTGLPWVVSGYAHTQSPLAGFAPVIGVYGIGGLVALCSAGLSTTFMQRKSWPILIAGSVLLLGQLLHTLHWSQPQGQPISVRLLQGNVAQDLKFDRNRVNDSLLLYQSMIEAEPADLIATPETAIPLFIQQVPPDYMARLHKFSRDSNSHLAVGLLIADGQNQYANSLIGISPGSENLYRYDKGHLVPFGEFVPTGFHWFVDLLGIPMSDQTPGKAWQRAWQIKDQAVLPNICFEDLFGEEIAHHMQAAAANGAATPSILLNVSNLAWFDNSLALPQHLQIAQMRAIETARPMLRATNTGATAIILPDGTVQVQRPFLQQNSISAKVQGMQGMTPYVRFGNGIMLMLAGLALVTAWALGKRPPK